MPRHWHSFLKHTSYTTLWKLGTFNKFGKNNLGEQRIRSYGIYMLILHSFSMWHSPLSLQSLSILSQEVFSFQGRIMQSSIALEMQSWGCFWFSSLTQLAGKGVFPLFYVLASICCSRSASFVLISQADLHLLRQPSCPGHRKFWATLIRHRRSEPTIFWYLLAYVPDSMKPGNLRRSHLRENLRRIRAEAQTPTTSQCFQETPLKFTEERDKVG